MRGKLEPHTHVWVPGEVIQDVKRLPRPNWGRTKEMPFSEFLHGIRQRNWCCRFYEPDAPLWKVSLPWLSCLIRGLLSERRLLLVCSISLSAIQLVIEVCKLKHHG